MFIKHLLKINMLHFINLLLLKIIKKLLLLIKDLISLINFIKYICLLFRV
jgi:hypothetical protein